MKKIIYFLFLTSALLFQSCVDEEEDKFDDSSANRIAAELVRVNELLVSSPNGWLMEYYMGPAGTTVGGVNFFCKFEDGNATLASEYDIPGYEPGTTATSRYRMDATQGPVLTFDTYNPILHYFSTASSSEVYGKYADYEFIVMKAESSRIEMIGKKFGKKIIMTPFSVDDTWDNYIQETKKVSDVASEAFYYNITVNGEQVSYSLYNSEDKRFDFEDNQLQNIIFTPEGMKFYEPVTVDGEVIERLYVNFSDSTFYVDQNGKNIVFRNVIPPGIRVYSDYLGEYELAYTDMNDRRITVDITFEEKVKEVSYNIRGLSSAAEMYPAMRDMLIEARYNFDKRILDTYIGLPSQQMDRVPGVENYDYFIFTSWAGSNYGSGGITSYVHRGDVDRAIPFTQIKFSSGQYGMWILGHHLDGNTYYMEPALMFGDIVMTRK